MHRGLTLICAPAGFDKRQWYRYHHLFADVLHAHLMREQPAQIPTLHRRASEWYEHNGLPAEAIRHALAAEDFERAAGLVELAWPAMDGHFQSATWLGWVGYLVFKSGYIPRALGILVMVASLGYLIDSFGAILSAGYNANVAQFTFVGEVLLMVWLLWKGVRLR